MNPLDLTQLRPLLQHTLGRPGVGIGLIDGPGATEHPDFASKRFTELAESTGAGVACRHGTFVVGVLAARCGSPPSPFVRTRLW